jgi:nucleotide-binding universal stress UspA family protein
MFKHILVPLDGSAFAEAAIPYALSLAVQYQAEVTLLRVVLPPRWQAMMEAESPALYEKLSRTAEQDAASYLEYQQAALRVHGLQVHIHTESGEAVAELILHVVAELRPDLLVMSTHGRSGLQRWMFGSVAERVLHQAAVPILLIRPTGAQSES